ncbi:LptA/OstA family protein [Aliikangiella sp. IMCC44653]
MKQAIKASKLFLISLFACYVQANTNFKITSDSLNGNMKNNVMEYLGNAQLLHENNQINGDKIIAFNAKNSANKQVEIHGSPAILMQTPKAPMPERKLFANKINYVESTKAIEAWHNVVMIQKENNTKNLKIQGTHLTSTQSPEFELKVQGTPLELNITQQGAMEIHAKAKELTYAEQTKTITLIGDVVLTNQQETIRAQKVIYQIDNGQIEIPKMSTGRVEIIQKKKPK